MKTVGFIFAAMIALVSCNNTNTGDVQKIKDLAKEDSIKSVQANQKDSLITSYLNDLNEIQENLDRIKHREKIITMKPAEMTSTDKQSVVAELKELDEWIVLNDKKMNNLQARLKKMDTKSNKLESLVAHLTQEIAEKDEEIADLQSQLGKANDSIKFLSYRFNDSIYIIKQQRAQIAVLTTVYYISGTMKELEDKGVINKEGGFIGMGRVAEITNSVDNNMFVKANMNSLKGVNLHGKFRRFITVHPDKAFQVITSANSDSVAINMPATFWSESKYLVVATK
jgi:hypothetical protein